MELFGRRQRLKEIAEREARGEDLWVDELEKDARYRIRYAVEDLVAGIPGYAADPLMAARGFTLRDLGIGSLSEAQRADLDYVTAIMQSSLGVVLTALEALLAWSSILAQETAKDWTYEERDTMRSRLPVFVADLKTILYEHRVKFDLIEGKFVAFESREMHEAVVAPTLTLLGGDSRFDSAEKAYRKAIEEIHSGDAADAITDAATALQEALSAVGCKGNTVSKKIRDAISKGLLTQYDSKLGDWLEADRSTKGDAHNAQAAHRSDGWLVVHITGALILRIAATEGR